MLRVETLTIEEWKERSASLDLSEDTITESESEHQYVRSSLNTYDTYSIGMMNILDVLQIYGKKDRAAFYINSELVLIVVLADEDNSIKHCVEQVLQKSHLETDRPGDVICGFINQLIKEDYRHLLDLEFAINDMEEEIHKSHVERAGIQNILSMKKKLIILRNYYEQLEDLCVGLLENKNQLLSQKELEGIKALQEKLERYCAHTQILRENVVQVKEAYTTTLDYNLNTTMKLFTVVTTVFLPLTLIVGWYGMNFAYMPELTWKYGYIFVMILSVSVVIACFWFFKRKHLL